MDPKNVCEKSSAKKTNRRKKKMMSIELKREIIEKYEQGVRVVDLSRQYGRNASMISSLLKRKESIKSVTEAKGLTIISKRRTCLHVNMEKLLIEWVTEKKRRGDTLTLTIICEKGRAIYRDLVKQTPPTSIDEEESFKASRGWFNNFKRRTCIHSVVGNGEASSSDMETAEHYIKAFSDLIMVFNCDDTEQLTQELTAEESQSQQHTEIKEEFGFEESEEEVTSTSEIEEILGMWERVSQFVEEKHPEKVATRHASDIFDTCLTHFRNILKETEEQTSTSEIEEILGMWETVSQFVEKKHPEKVATGNASDFFNDTCLTHFRNILKERKGPTPLEILFSKRRRGDSEKNTAKKAKTSEDI